METEATAEFSGMDGFLVEGVSLWDLLPPDHRLASDGPPVPAPTWAERMFAILSRHFGSDLVALEFMRFAAGCVLEMPTQAMVEAFAVERAAARRMRHDPSPAAVNHLGDFHGPADKRDFSKVHQKCNGKGLADDRNSRKAWEQHCKDNGMTCTLAAILARRPGILVPVRRLVI